MTDLLKVIGGIDGARRFAFASLYQWTKPNARTLVHIRCDNCGEIGQYEVEPDQELTNMELPCTDGRLSVFLRQVQD